MVEEQKSAENVAVPEDHPQVILINKVLDKVEDFYFEDGPDSGEKLFATFAERHHEKFDDEIDCEGSEHKLE